MLIDSNLWILTFFILKKKEKKGEGESFFL